MSLKDTIAAARREAREAGGIFSGNKEEEASAGKAEESQGFTRRTAASAKPSREKAAQVRVVTVEDARAGRSGKKPSEMTKEERKAERAAVRDADDLRNMAATVLLNHDEEYAKIQRIWWILLGAGLALTIVSFGINWLMNSNQTYAVSGLAITAIAAMVVAYALVIGAFIYDLVKGRPIRRRVDEEVKGMSKRRLEAIVREDAEEKAAKDAAKKAKK